MYLSCNLKKCDYFHIWEGTISLQKYYRIQGLRLTSNLRRISSLLIGSSCFWLPPIPLRFSRRLNCIRSHHRSLDDPFVWNKNNFSKSALLFFAALRFLPTPPGGFHCDFGLAGDFPCPNERTQTSGRPASLQRGLVWRFVIVANAKRKLEILWRIVSVSFMTGLICACWNCFRSQGC